MYFDNIGRNTFNALNLTGSYRQPQTLWNVGSLVPYAIAVDASFIYLSSEHPRCVQLSTGT